MKRIGNKLIGFLGMAMALPFMAASCNMGYAGFDETDAAVLNSCRAAETEKSYMDFSLEHEINALTNKLVQSGSSDPAILDGIVMEAAKLCPKDVQSGMVSSSNQLNKDMELVNKLYNNAVGKKRIQSYMQIGSCTIDKCISNMIKASDVGSKAIKASPLTGKDAASWKAFANENAEQLNDAVFNYLGLSYDEPFPMLVDYICRNAYAFEAMGYNLRENIRREFAESTANAAFMAVYSYMSNGKTREAERFLKFVNCFDNLLKDDKIQTVKRHDDKVICQIPFDQNGVKMYYVMDKEVKEIDYTPMFRSYSSQWDSRYDFREEDPLRDIYNGHKLGDGSIGRIYYMPKNFYDEIVLNWSNGETLQSILLAGGMVIPNMLDAAEKNCFVYEGKISFNGYRAYDSSCSRNGTFESASITAYNGASTEKAPNGDQQRIANGFECGYTCHQNAMIFFSNNNKCFGKNLTGNHFYYNTIAQKVTSLGSIK